MQINHAALAPSLSPENPIFREQFREMSARFASSVPDPSGTAMVVMQHRLEKQALSRAFSQSFAELAIFIAIGFLVVPLLRPASEPRRLPKIKAIVNRLRSLPR